MTRQKFDEVKQMMKNPLAFVVCLMLFSSGNISGWTFGRSSDMATKKDLIELRTEIREEMATRFDELDRRLVNLLLSVRINGAHVTLERRSGDEILPN